MKNWKNYFQQWVDMPLAVRSTGDVKNENHFRNCVENISSLLQISSNDVVLDVGCDSGLLTQRIRKKVSRAVGIDFIEGQIKDAVCQDFDSVYVVADALWLPFKDKIFTKVYCYNVIHNLPSEEAGIRVIEECLRVCTEYGKVLIGDITDIRKKERFWGLYYWWGYYKKRNWKKKMRMVIALIIPNWLKDLLKNYYCTKVSEKQDNSIKTPKFIWYDSQELKHMFEKRGLLCQIVNQSRHLHDSFYRCNLLIEKPKRTNNLLEVKNEETQHHKSDR